MLFTEIAAGCSVHCNKGTKHRESKVEELLNVNMYLYRCALQSGSRYLAHYNISYYL